MISVPCIHSRVGPARQSVGCSYTSCACHVQHVYNLNSLPKFLFRHVWVYFHCMTICALQVAIIIIMQTKQLCECVCTVMCLCITACVWLPDRSSDTVTAKLPGIIFNYHGNRQTRCVTRYPAKKNYRQDHNLVVIPGVLLWQPVHGSLQAISS